MTVQPATAAPGPRLRGVRVNTTSEPAVTGWVAVTVLARVRSMAGRGLLAQKSFVAETLPLPLAATVTRSW